MRPSHLVVIVVTAIALAVAPGVAAQEGAGGEGPAMTPEMQAEMEMWMKLAKPGAHHTHLEAYVGRWAGEVSMWMTPGTEPMVETSEAEATLILGGRFLEWKHTGNFMGSPFDGRAIEGYNNGDQRYESTWVDNFGTLVLYYTGSCSDDGRSREMTTSFRDPMTDSTITYRAAYTWQDADHFTYTAWMDKGEGEFKNMEIRYSRK